MSKVMQRLADNAAIGITLLYFLHLEAVFAPLPPQWMIVTLILCAFGCFLFLHRFSRYGSCILALALLAVLLFSAFLFPSLWKLLYNATLDAYRPYSSLTFFPYPIDLSPAMQEGLLVVGIAAMFWFLCMLFDCLLRICRWPRMAALVLLCLLIPCVLHHVPQPFTIIGWTAVFLSLLLKQGRFALAARTRVIFLLGSAAILLLCVAIFPKESVWERGEWLRDQLLTRLMTQVTSGSDSEQVDLKQAGNRSYIGSVHLSISGEPQTYYLHTYSGGCYLENTWRSPQEELDEAFDYLALLQQLKPYDDALTPYQSDERPTSSAIVVEDYRSSERLALPYYLHRMRYFSPHAYQDSYLLRPKDTMRYQYDVWNTDVYQGYAAHSYTFPSLQDDYGRFVMEHYTTLSAQQTALFEDLGLRSPADMQDASLQEVSGYIRNYLRTHANYTLSPGNLAQGEDFVTYFLTQTHQGYCVHYASAAALMLRYYGYPTRYAEGYRVSAADFDETHTAAVRDYHAHAWVEVYDGVLGWVPLEFTTAASYDETVAGEETGDDTNDIEEVVSPAPNTPSERGEQPITPKEEPTRSAQNYSWLRWLLYPLSLLALYALSLLVRHHRLLRHEKESDVNTAVIDGYRILMHLQTQGIEPDPRAKQLAQQARFSKEGVTEAQRQEMTALVQSAIAQIRTLPWRKRWRLYFICAIW